MKEEAKSEYLNDIDEYNKQNYQKKEKEKEKEKNFQSNERQKWTIKKELTGKCTPFTFHINNTHRLFTSYKLL